MAKSKKWSANEVEFVSAFYPYFSTMSIARVLGRSEASVDYKVNDLNVKKKDGSHRSGNLPKPGSYPDVWTIEQYLMAKRKLITRYA